MKRWEKLEQEGWEFVSYEYVDHCLPYIANKLTDAGYEVRYNREKSDTKGVRMVSVWKRK